MITCIHGNYKNCCCRKCYAYHKDVGSPNCSKCHVERCPCVDLGLDKPNEAQYRANRYTIETLKPLNHSYHDRYRISQGDVNMVNMLVDAIESNLKYDEIQPGDIVELTTKHGNYYKNAHFESFDHEDGLWRVCEQPMIPFVFFSDNKRVGQFSTSGGAWCTIPNNLKRIGKRVKIFNVFGHNGPCAGGAIAFEAVVNVWEYKEPDPLYGDYSTKFYDRQYFTIVDDSSKKPRGDNVYRYQGSFIGIHSKQDYDAWRDTYRGVEFPGNWPNQIVVFFYKTISVLVSKEEYDALDLPVDTRYCNGVIEVKVLYDDTAHTVTEYRWTNSGAELCKKGVEPYVLARHNGSKLNGGGEG